MTVKIADLIPTVSPSVPYKDQFNDIILSPEEIEYALFEVRKRKTHLIKEAEYWEQVKKDSVPLILTGEQMKLRIMAEQKKKGSEFIIDKWNEDIFNTLLLYFTNDPEFEKDGRSLKKGVLIQGNIGCGKTVMLRAFSQNQKQSFFMSTCNKVAEQFSIGGYHGKDGNEGIQKYFSPMRYERCPFGFATRGYMFDDLGTERSKKFFGNESNVMEEIILGWYNFLETRPERIHLTTNLTADEIGDMYGSRVKSRMREMFNVLTFDKNAPDRRK